MRRLRRLARSFPALTQESIVSKSCRAGYMQEYDTFSTTLHFVISPSFPTNYTSIDATDTDEHRPARRICKDRLHRPQNGDYHVVLCSRGQGLNLVRFHRHDAQCERRQTWHTPRRPFHLHSISILLSYLENCATPLKIIPSNKPATSFPPIKPRRHQPLERR